MITDDLQRMPKPTAQERSVITYILEHPDAVATCTVRELAQASYTSPPTVVRLCQKLGFKGFPEFRMQFATEQKAQRKHFFADFSHALVEEGGSIEDIQRVMPQFYNSIAHETNSHVSAEQLAELKGLVRNARVLDLYATGMNYHTAARSAFLIQTLGIPCTVYDEANVHMLERLDERSGHLSFLLSHTGRNVKVIEVARILASRHMPTVAIVERADSPLGKVADTTIELFSTPTPNRLSLLSYAISLAYVFDLLYASLLADELGDMYQGSSSAFYDALSE